MANITSQEWTHIFFIMSHQPLSSELQVYCTQQQFTMFDKQKMKELQQRSHNRGLLSKQFYLNEQQQLQRKRKEMKAELDRQVEERRRQKELEKLENERRIRKEEEEIKNYYKHLESRDKRTSPNQSSAMQASNMKQATQPYQTYPTEMQSDSRQKGISLNRSKAAQSKPYLIQGDIPLLPVMSDPPVQSLLSISKQSVGNITNMGNIGNIPLLNLSDEGNPAASKARKVKQKTTKREKTQQAAQQKVQNSRQANNAASIVLRQQRRSTFADQQSIFGSVVHGPAPVLAEKTENYEIPEQVMEIQQENKSLKVQLRRKEEALSLLMGAVRSNGNVKLDKYRVQAERILHGQQSLRGKEEQREQQKGIMLPKIHMKHQSIMHDYILAAARRGRKGHL